MQKFFVYLLYKIEGHVWKSIAIAVVVIVLLILSASTTWYETAWYMARDSNDNRGATTVPIDALGDAKLSKVVFLNQNWDASDSLWFYNTTQGSDLLPYDFFMALEQATSQEPFRSAENMNRYRYLPQQKTGGNPDALPVGMVADKYRGEKYMGFTCAACHTSQVDYNGVGIRIDGGPGEADMDGFMNGLADSLDATTNDAAKKQRFETAVLNAGHYKDTSQVEADLKTFTLRLKAYNFFNESVAKDPKGNEIPVPYGYSRLDAFGRIYNRVLEHVLNSKALDDVLSGALGLSQANALLKELKVKSVLSAEDRDHVELQLVTLLNADQQRALRNQLFNSPNAPVSYPFLWDIPQHDFVQWNGIGGNSGAGPLGRNTGEVIGVFATLDWEETERGMPAPLTSWLGLGPKNISFRSSAQQHNLLQIEDRLKSLEAPAWDDAVQQAGLPAIDTTRAAHGETLFGAHCASCHQVINRTDAGRRIVAEMDSLAVAGTDPAMASNSVRDMGFSGILRNQYAKTDVGSVLLNTQAPVAALLIKATENVVATPDPDKFFITRWADWLVDLIRSIHENEIKPSVKSGNYTPDTTDAPFDSLLAYKGRALDGIWATAPYLHNGSVPTLYDLLLPAGPAKDKNGKEIADPPGTVYRPKKFMVGSRELDPVKVGFKSNPDDYHGTVPGSLFDTSLPGNSNAGHDYGTRDLSDDDRKDLVEYLKTL